MFQTTRVRDIRRYRRTRPYTLADSSMSIACLDYVLLLYMERNKVDWEGNLVVPVLVEPALAFEI